MNNIYYNYFESPIGLIEIGGTSAAITALNFVDERRKGSESHPYVDSVLQQSWGDLELLVIDDEIKELTTTRACSHVIKQVAVEKGMSTLRENGLRKAMAGETTLEEVCRVTQDSVQTSLKVGEHVGG